MFLIIDTTYPINTRTERFRQSIAKEYGVAVCAWTRSLSVKEEGSSNYFLYKTSIGFGNQIKKILYLPFFVFFSLRVALKIKPKFIFASHWDSLICAVAIKLIAFRKVKIIYDCLDMPTASNRIINKALTWVEHFNLKWVDLTIFASRFFKPLYPKKIKSLIFENYPSQDTLENQVEIPSWIKIKNIELYKNKKNIAWIGVVRYFEILENILYVIKDTDFSFYVFGDGPDLNKLKSKVKEMNLDSKVEFFGRYSPSDLKFIYDMSGLVWAAYPTQDFNAVYAISNKYFECSYFNKPPIISSKTKMAENLIDNKSVILVDEYSVKDIKDKVTSFKVEAEFKKYEPDVLWEQKEGELLAYIRENLCH